MAYEISSNTRAWDSGASGKHPTNDSIQRRSEDREDAMDGGTNPDTLKGSEQGVFCWTLGLADLGRVRSFRTLADLERDGITFAKRVERHTHELVGVEKEILFLTFDLDEAETLIGETGDSSCLHCNGIF
jgi:hypothetical protein